MSVSSDASGNLEGGSTDAYIDQTEISTYTADIAELRRTSAIQRWLEKQARGGARYIETIKTHFGITSSDARMQRAEYLGGERIPMVISEVLNTSATATEPQGDMAGHGISIGQNSPVYLRAEEHGYIMGILSVLPRTAYQQGIPKHFLYDDKLDFPWPEFANLGEQEIKQEELYWDRTAADSVNNATFGYQQRFAECKFAQSTVHGDFRSSLNYWHMGRIFSSAPALNWTFVKSDPTTRIFAAAGTDQTLWVQIYHDMKAARQLPYFANPQLS